MNDLRRRHRLVANINLIEEFPQKQEKSWFSPVKFNCFSGVKNGNNLSFFSAPLTVIKKNTSVLIRMIYTLSNIYVFHHTKEENSKIKCCPMIQKIIFLWWQYFFGWIDLSWSVPGLRGNGQQLHLEEKKWRKYFLKFVSWNQMVLLSL